MSPETPKKRTLPVSLYRDKCIGCGSCELMCPKYWKIDDDGKATLKDSQKIKNFYRAEIDAEDYGINKLAADLCPTKVIKLD
jgi:ferredoxin